MLTAIDKIIYLCLPFLRRIGAIRHWTHRILKGRTFIFLILNF